MTYAQRKAQHLATMRAITNGPRVQVGPTHAHPLLNRGCVHTRPRRTAAA
jgi:hypothetical protein